MRPENTGLFSCFLLRTSKSDSSLSLLLYRTIITRVVRFSELELLNQVCIVGLCASVHSNVYVHVCLYALMHPYVCVCM